METRASTHRPPLGPFARFWQEDRGLSALLGCLVAVIFVFPTLLHGADHTVLLPVVSQIFFTFILLFGITASNPSRSVLLVAWVVVGTAIVLQWLHSFVPVAALGACKAAAGVVAIGMLTVLVVGRVLHEGPITFHRVRGAVAVYLLLGLTWGGVYEMIAYLQPGAFRMAEPPASPEELGASLGYFSFVTLTTLGYGDVLPLHPAARSAAVLEALVGQLFPAILIARLVAMELASRDRDRRSE